MMAKMRMGSKGQVVIPKMFRDDLGLKTGEEVIVERRENEVAIKKTASNIVEIARAIAMSGKKHKLTIDEIKKGYYKQLDDRYERALKHRLSGQ
ncbi:AbrB/MazE/SpoVT family DNA-binding domain-containing protein [Candidatus Woesearchaeota archaeon]|nr:AbrB/MazE/SpoVT family DNA-binding domain-containing protein [Candidatus Woesearchaeota archaeon]